ncbi:hypothetical protein SNE40_015113 [Patella caerulea]
MAAMIILVYLVFVIGIQKGVLGLECSNDNSFNASRLSKIVYDSANKKYYLAGSIFIYQLNDSLCKEEIINRQNKNHILVKYGDALIFCGTGNCYIAKFSNISEHCNTTVKLLPNLPPTVALVGNISGGPVLILAVSAPNGSMNGSEIYVCKLNTSPYSCNNSGLDLGNYIPKAGFIRNDSVYFISQNINDTAGAIISRFSIQSMDLFNNFKLNKTMIDCGESESLIAATITRGQENETHEYISVSALFEDALCNYEIGVINDHLDNISNNGTKQKLNSTSLIPLLNPNLSSTATLTSFPVIGANYTLYYIGTASGTIFRSHVESTTTMYNGFQLQFRLNSSIHEIKFVNDGIVALTRDEVKFLSEKDCFNKTWENCLKNEDGLGLCGWCIKDNRCAVLSECKNISYWLPSIEEIPRVFSNSSFKMGENTTQQIIFDTTFLEQVGNFSCVYGNNESFHAVQENGKLACNVPVIEGTGISNLRVVLEWEQNGGNRSKVAGQNLFYYNCSALNKSSCVLPKNANCIWCQCNNTCFDSDEMCTTPSEDITASNITFNKGPEAGGTTLNITGDDCDNATKDEIVVEIGDKFNCKDIDYSSTGILCKTSPGNGSDLSVKVTCNCKTFNLNSNFSYAADPELMYIEPNKTIASGGVSITLFGEGFDSIQQPQIGIVESSDKDFVDCKGNNGSIVICPAPPNPPPPNPTAKRRKREVDRNIQITQVVIKMDGVQMKTNMTYVLDPMIHEFEEANKVRTLSKENKIIVIKGSRLNEAVEAADYTVSVGTGNCLVFAKITNTELTCLRPEEEPNKNNESSPAPEVQVRVGNLVKLVGFLRYPDQDPDQDPTLYIVIGILLAFVLAVVIVAVIVFKYVSERNKTKFREGIEKTEMEVIAQCREAFADLQTDMTDITAELVELGIPFNNLFTYVFQFVFPQCSAENIKSHTALNDLQKHEGTQQDMAASMIKLDQLISNKFFMASLIRTLDSQRKFKLQERSDVAGYLTLLLINRMDYFTEIVEMLLPKLIRESVTTKQQQNLFKRCETVTETLVVNWLAVCMYNSLKKRSGSALFMLYKAIEILSQKCAIDAVTHQARATLCQHNLLVMDSEPEVLNLTVLINNGKFKTTCRVLDCDTITQVKNKCLNASYKAETTSDRPGVEEIDLEWHQPGSTRKLLYDEDVSSVIGSNGYRKLNTMKHHGVEDGSTVCLLSKEIADDANEHYANFSSFNESQKMISTEDTESIELLELPTFHLVRIEDKQKTKKALPELSFNRLLQTKVNLKNYIDDVIEHTLDLDDIPIPVRHLFSILEKSGSKECQDSTTIESWKIQSYAMRFWAKLLLRPELLFDLNKESQKYVQPNLNVIQLAYIDSFSPPQSLDKNSPSYKLMFFKDCVEYRDTVQSFFQSKRICEQVSSRELSAELASLPTMAASIPINRQSVLYQIYSVIDSYIGQIITDLDEMNETSRLQLSTKLDNVFETMRNS